MLLKITNNFLSRWWIRCSGISYNPKVDCIIINPESTTCLINTFNPKDIVQRSDAVGWWEYNISGEARHFTPLYECSITKAKQLIKNKFPEWKMKL